ncbi:DUF1566 domain-containing protein [Marinicellulosiphila megalodicopiae]|uniref:Lcl C-terminal domain-containing protein n=1 Tax=Marinicellulosiphila megalodicopiae TaxID=2724896 RepID=UPI003BB1C43C
MQCLSVFFRINFIYLSIFLSIFLFSCTGNPPFSEAGDDQTVSYQQSVELKGKTWDKDGDIFSQTWVQIYGTPVDLIKINDTDVSFLAPVSNETMMFTFNVIDSKGSAYKDPVYITVEASNPLNDTGVLLCADYATAANGSTIENNDVDCSLEFESINGDVVPFIQDGQTGLDTSVLNQQGFDFTKLNNDGLVLDEQEPVFSCVRDNHTGLIWEVKTTDGSLHDTSSRFNWYQTNSDINAGNAGFENDDGDICVGFDINDSSTYCNTHAFVERVNKQGLCGLTQWRLPTRQELLSIVDFSRTQPAINIDYFPNTATFSYWSINNHAAAGQEDKAWYVYFNDGSSSTSSKDSPNDVRLVHDITAQ